MSFIYIIICNFRAPAVYEWLRSRGCCCSNALVRAAQRPPSETLTVGSADKLTFKPNNIHVNIWAAALTYWLPVREPFIPCGPHALWNLFPVYFFCSADKSGTCVSGAVEKGALICCTLWLLCFLSENSIAWLFLFYRFNQQLFMTDYHFLVIKGVTEECQEFIYIYIRP